MPAEARQRTGAARPKRAGATPDRPLRRRDEPMRERRFAPGDSFRAIVGVVALSLGGVALGAGVYGQWLRGAGAWVGSPYLMVGGAVLLAVYLVFGRDLDRPLRIGELGVGVERDGKTLERLAWCEIEAIGPKGRGLEVRGARTSFTLSLERHGKAAARLVSEAAARVPDRLQLGDALRARIGRPGANDGDVLVAEPPQVVDELCRASERPLTIEKDVRMCARCAALYHKAAVPRRCVVCDAKLKA
ncbi:MAG: hypothetical protein IT373_02820 [Polyangiaceae bacterium]|nr:hypothetical protein [Polyangiaceae bacterium]